LQGSDEPPEPEEDWWQGERPDDGEGCDYCEWSDKCRYCPSGENVQYATCPQGVPMYEREGYQFLVNLLVNKGLASSPWDAENKLSGEQTDKCIECRIGCEGCDYQWQRERIDLRDAAKRAERDGRVRRERGEQ
jgi:hypothetical protein